MPEQSSYEIVRRRAEEDPDFRERLLADPRAVIAEVRGEALPEDLEVEIIENTPNKVHLVVPAADLTDADTDAVAAGARHCFNSACF
ncbi:MAG TPA: NHLP leader peptide family RiPP precursor [Candidatus Nanopelagicales bacterium]|nr:NHLP leader peptide family RiPP precursor [Candidatus Nanopelagicales bacterium]